MKITEYVRATATRMKGRLNESQVKEIRHEYMMNKTSVRKLAEKYNVCKSTIYGIVKNESWRYVQ